jgi:HEAT repeat protein
VQRQAVAALAAIVSRYPNPSAYGVLKGKLTDKDSNVREWAVVGVAALESRRDRWAALLPALSDAASSVRSAACREYAHARFSEMSPTVRRKITAALEGLQDADRSADVRAAARNALDVMG